MVYGATLRYETINHIRGIQCNVTKRSIILQPTCTIMSNHSPKKKRLEKEQGGTSPIARGKPTKGITKKETLKQFLSRQQRQLYALRRDYPLLGDRIVLLTYNGPKLLDAPKNFGSVRNLVNSCQPFFTSITRTAVKTLDFPLADHLFALRDKLPGVIENLNLIDPIGDGNCCYYALQLFGAFLLDGGSGLRNGKQLREAVNDHTKMRQFVKDYLTKNLKYFLQSEGMSLCQRPSGVSDEDWRNGGREVIRACMENQDLNIEWTDREDCLLNCTTLKPPSPTTEDEWMSKYHKMDKRHFEVFAKATKSRIVVLSYDPNTDRYFHIDLDWREGVESVFYSHDIPDFGEDFDFYRTGIFTLGPTAVEIDNDFELFLSDHNGNHFAFWIPNEYPDKLHGRTPDHSENDIAEGTMKQRLKKKNGTQKRKKIVVDEDSDNDTADGPIDRRLKKKGTLKRKKIVVNDTSTEEETKEETKEESNEETNKETNQETNEETNGDVTYQLQYPPPFEAPKTNLFEDIVLELPSAEDLEGYVEPSGDAETVEDEIPGRNIGNIDGGIDGTMIPVPRSLLTDTATGVYTGSTEWFLVNWLKSEENIKLWDNSKMEKQKKEKIYFDLAKMINEDGLKNHRMDRGRTGKRVGEQINKVLRDTRTIYAKVKDAVNNGATTEEVKQISARSRYYDILFPTVKGYL